MPVPIAGVPQSCYACSARSGFRSIGINAGVVAGLVPATPNVKSTEPK
jgi:hypothetical protein